MECQAEQRRSGAESQRAYRARKRLRSLDLSHDTALTVSTLRIKTGLTADALVSRGMALLAEALAAGERPSQG